MRTINLIAALLSLPTLWAAGHAEVYFSQDQVARALLPGLALKPAALDLSSDEAKTIEKACGERVLNRHLSLWVGKQRQVLFVDKVVGKHDFITFALALSADGKVLGLEVMEYLESYGKQVRGQKWRDQFVGKDKTAVLRVGKDIDALSGATLSATHVSGGVRRLLQTYAVIRTRIP